MNLSFDVQLQVALRALNEVVAPALGHADKHVAEQFQLVLATIGFVKTRLPEARRYYRMELRHYVDLVTEAAEHADNGAHLAAVIDEAKTVLADAEADIAEYETITRRLRDAVTTLVSRCTDPEERAALHRLILDRSGEMLPQYRLWASPFGLELKPEALPAPAW